MTQRKVKFESFASRLVSQQHSLYCIKATLPSILSHFEKRSMSAAKVETNIVCPTCLASSNISSPGVVPSTLGQSKTSAPNVTSPPTTSLCDLVGIYIGSICITVIVVVVFYWFVFGGGHGSTAVMYPHLDNSLMNAWKATPSFDGTADKHLEQSGSHTHSDKTLTFKLGETNVMGEHQIARVDGNSDHAITLARCTPFLTSDYNWECHMQGNDRRITCPYGRQSFDWKCYAEKNGQEVKTQYTVECLTRHGAIQPKTCVFHYSLSQNKRW